MTAPVSSPRHPAVLHVSAAEGGGIDRYIRDLAASGQRRHILWHTGSGIDVVEDLGAKRFLPLSNAIEDSAAATPLADWMRANAIGIIHLHTLSERCRRRLSLLQAVRATPWLVTLHDLTFIDPQAFTGRVPEPDFAWIAEVSHTLAHAATVIAPSAYIRALALRHFPNARCEIVQPGIATAPNSVRPSVPAEFAAQRLEHIVAVIGAIGPHKGSGLLDAIVNRLHETDIGVVVIGYVDSQLSQGWRVPGRCYVHGPYLNGDLPGLIESYGVDVALFPNRLPESFSYTLSEVWSAGVPVIVPEEGALAERVGLHRGGWLLPERFSATDAAQFLQRLFAPESAGERARVKSQIDPRDPARIPTLAAMARDIDAIYERFGAPTSGSDAKATDEALQPLLAANLDGFVFRKELMKLTGEAVQLKAALEEARPWAAKLEHDIREAQSWSRKLEREIDVLTAEAKRLFDDNRRLLDDKAAFDQLPLVLRKLLLKRAFRARR